MIKYILEIILDLNLTYLFISIIIPAYFLGAIPSSIIIVRKLKNIDIRDVGSKNAGATNVVRVCGKKIGGLVLLADMSKSIVATTLVPNIMIYISKTYFSYDALSNIELVYLQLLGGVLSVVGHVWTCFAQFKGGKGIACGMGIMLGIFPLAILVATGVFLVVYAFTKTVSISNLVTAYTNPLILYYLENYHNFEISVSLYYLVSIFAVFATYTHRDNLMRVIKGEELSFKKK